MSDQEHTKIDSLIKKFDQHAEYTREELSQIKRGIYGDPANKVPGLMDRQIEDERRLKLIEEQLKAERIRKNTLLWVGGIVWGLLSALFTAIYKTLFG